MRVGIEKRSSKIVASLSSLDDRVVDGVMTGARPIIRNPENKFLIIARKYFQKPFGITMGT
jgi:hypothetical protein